MRFHQFDVEIIHDSGIVLYPVGYRDEIRAVRQGTWPEYYVSFTATGVNVYEHLKRVIADEVVVEAVSGLRLSSRKEKQKKEEV